jgi:predicted homoserine dehydrogenase-like protein
LDGEGGFTVYGRLVRAEASLRNAYLPMGLTGNARLIRPVAKDGFLTYADVELDETLLSFTLRKSMEEENRVNHF